MNKCGGKKNMFGAIMKKLIDLKKKKWINKVGKSKYEGKLKEYEFM